MTDNDRSRIENANINRQWISVSSAFDDYISQPLISREKQQQLDANALVPALNGYLKKISALSNTPNIDNALSNAKKSVERYNAYKGTTFEDEVFCIQKLLKEV